MRARSSQTPLAVSRSIRGRPSVTIDLGDLEKDKIIYGPDFLPILGERLSFFIAGPPGCGKSTTASDLMNLIPDIPKFLFSDVDQDRAFEGSFTESGPGKLNRVHMEEDVLKLLSPQRLINESKMIQVRNKLKSWGIYSDSLFDKTVRELGLKEAKSEETKPEEEKVEEPAPEVAPKRARYSIGFPRPAVPTFPSAYSDFSLSSEEEEISPSKMKILREIPGDCWVIFDDVDKIRDPAVSKLVTRLMDNIVANGRSHDPSGESHIHIIVTNHSLNDYRLTKYTCENCEYWVIFPNKSMRQQVVRLLSKLGLEKERIYNEDRVIIHKSVPLFIMTPKYVRLLS